MTTLKERLEDLNRLEQEIQAKRKEIYRESLNSPSNEKVCPDSLAALNRDHKPFAYPIEVLAITPKEVTKEAHPNCGRLVAIRPCDAEKTYLGIYLGDFHLGVAASYNRESQVLTIEPGYGNPTIYIPQLKKVVRGAESWWRYLETEELQDIQDEDIQEAWFVKAIQEMSSQSHDS